MNASKTDLKEYLEGRGFQRCEHFWEWPKGTANYSWFDNRDFRSIDGVSADIFPVSVHEVRLAPAGWALHVRNLHSASWHDVRMLNDVLRGARRRFGGTIKGDYGTNRYAPLWDDQSTPISRGIAAVYSRVTDDLRAVKYALPDPAVQAPSPDPRNKKMQAFADFTRSLDPARVIYNGLVPFAVAMFEHFFSRTFRVLIAYDPNALKKRALHNLRVDFPTLLKVSGGQQTVEDVIASAYTFQNLRQLNKAYKDWLDIDVRKVLFKRKRIGRSTAILENRIAELIQYRHGVVHRFELDRSLSKEGYFAVLSAVEASMQEFVRYLERKYAITIEYNR